MTLKTKLNCYTYNQKVTWPLSYKSTKLVDGFKLKDLKLKGFKLKDLTAIHSPLIVAMDIY